MRGVRRGDAPVCPICSMFELFLVILSLSAVYTRTASRLIYEPYYCLYSSNGCTYLVVHTWYAAFLTRAGVFKQLARLKTTSGGSGEKSSRTTKGECALLQQ